MSTEPKSARPVFSPLAGPTPTNGALPQDARRGAFLMIVACFLFAIMAALVKGAASELPNPMIVFFRKALGLIFLTPWLLHGGLAAVRTERLPGHMVRSISGVASIYCFFFAIAHLRLADAVTLSYSSALFVPIVERLWLKSEVAPRLWGGIFLGFAGVTLIVKPGAAAFQPVALVGLAAGLLGALAQTGIRSLSATEPPARIVFYFIAVGATLSALPLPWYWQLPSARASGQLLMIGLLATYAQLLLTRAYAWASAAQVGPFIYSGALFSAVFDLLLWGRTPDALAGGGAILIILASILVLRSSKLRPWSSHQRS